MLFAPAVGVLAVRVLLPKSVTPVRANHGSWNRPLAQESRILALRLVWPDDHWTRGTVCRSATRDVSISISRIFRDFIISCCNARAAKPHWRGFQCKHCSLIQFGSLLIAPGINAIFAFGEEWGWRGFLLPKLLPLGQWPALLLAGISVGTLVLTDHFAWLRLSSSSEASASF